ncbi:glycosyltransferase family 4 protein [Oceanibacterium hippocampi]|uniref:GDP-mannose-dependent alpha-mannosyltransferase n=1 Tax=Oceanibacterium hippocampi TaxID=745714 RepID=A0A1Y5S5F7_9PROT|nr:glycosyltransferase family 1 protein [Oceanibacterium hippocampi]SLN32109.1 GDP-mannose-dependent alpha-mannosyltransferase [Oceanibacterium hippocampi]
MRLVLVTDAWHPQVNGVVRTLQAIGDELVAMGHDVVRITPSDFRTLPCPTYPEIRLSLTGRRGVGRRIAAADPDFIHIATEGPLGIAARRYCVGEGLHFTTGFHTRFPEYLRARAPIPLAWSYAFLRWFHGPSSNVMVPTESVRQVLVAQGFDNLRIVSRGVDTELYRLAPADAFDLPRPIAINVGRVAVEKNIQAFLDMPFAGSKVVVGDGPMLGHFRRRYPDVIFTGAKFGAELARHYASADVFVFPSRTDTFGLVLLEALAAGTPVAAYPVSGPKDVIGKAAIGCLDDDLAQATRRALQIPREDCRRFALGFSWRAVAESFLDILAPACGQIRCDAFRTRWKGRRRGSR